MGWDNPEQVEVRSASQLRSWLERNHRQSGSIWLVTYKKSGAFPERHVAYRDIVRQALCFGWIDSLPRKLDADRTMLRLSPRKPGSSWSAVNKAHVAELISKGLMEQAGLAAVDRAVADGSWSALDEASRLVEPQDLMAALDASPVARANWNRFPTSSRRAILEWITGAKQAETRARRVAETVSKAEENLKANFPEGRNRGPRP